MRGDGRRAAEQAERDKPDRHRGPSSQSIFRLAALMTLAHLSDSFCRYAANASSDRDRLHHQRLEESFVNLRIVDDLLHVGIDLDENLARRALRREQAERHGSPRSPATVSAMVGTSGICGDALLAAEAQHVDLAGGDGRQCDRWPHRDHVDVAGDQVVERGRGAAVMDGRHLDAGETFQQQRGGVQRGADARGAVGHRAGLRLGERDQFGDRLRRHRRMHQQADRNAGVARHRDEVGLRIVGQLALGVEMRLAGGEAGFGGRAACSRRRRPP